MVTNAYVMNLANKKRQKVSKLDIIGVFPNNKADECKAAIVNVKKAVQGLNVNANIFCRAQVG